MYLNFLFTMSVDRFEQDIYDDTLRMSKYKTFHMMFENELLMRYITRRNREDYGVCQARMAAIYNIFRVPFEGQDCQDAWKKEDITLLERCFTDLYKQFGHPFYASGRGEIPMLDDSDALEIYLSDELQVNTTIRQHNADNFQDGTDFYQNELEYHEARHQYYHLIFYIALQNNITIDALSPAQTYQKFREVSHAMKEYCKTYFPPDRMINYDPSSQHSATTFDTTRLFARQITDLASANLTNEPWSTQHTNFNMDQQMRAYNQKHKTFLKTQANSVTIKHTAAVEKLKVLQSDYDKRDFVMTTRATDGIDVWMPRHWT